MKNTILIMAVVATTTTSAGFLDGIQKISGGVVEAAGSAVNATVNVTTNTVQSISDTLNAPTEQASPNTMTPNSTINVTPNAVQSNPAGPGASASQTQPNAVTSASMGERTRTIRGSPTYAKDRADLEKRLQSFRFREDFQSIESVSERNRIANRITAAKSSLMPLPRTEGGEGKASRQLTELMELESAIIADMKEVLKREKSERDARDLAAKQQAERDARERAEPEAREKAEREERDLAAKQQAERDARERAEREAREKAERERIAAEKVAVEKARRDAIALVHEVLAKFHAKAAGNPEGYEFRPVPVYRGVKLGMTVEEVCSALDIKDAQGFLSESSNYDKWIGGKAKQVKLKDHTLMLRFAQIPGCTQSALISAQLAFNDADNAPVPAKVCEKYVSIPGVKASKVKEPHGDKFRDGIPKFWKVVYWKITNEIKLQKEQRAENRQHDLDLLSRLEADEKAIRAVVVEDVFREVDVFDVDGMQIRVKPKIETGKTSIVTFDDVVYSDQLSEIKKDAIARKVKAIEDAKSAAEKKAKSDSLNF